MTLLHAILKKVQSNESVTRTYPSPPPEINKAVIKPRKKKHTSKYAHVNAVVDTAPPRFDPLFQYRNLQQWSRNMRDLISENMKLVTTIKRQHFLRGRVDSSWSEYPKSCRQYFDNRNCFYKRIRVANQYLYNRIMNVKPKVPTTVALRHDWHHNRNEILERARCKFVLFQALPSEHIEDIQFKAPPGIKRPRVYLTLRFRHGAVLGELPVELFTDVCPLTCQLFLELVDGDGLGIGYIGTCFFRKVPNLYWSGGDVIYNSGFGCYAQRGRTFPIGAENYHFPHSMPGLLSMRMTRDDEMCGIFNITFKPLLQFDLKNVVFGRVIRPNNIYNIVRDLGSALSVQLVEIAATRRRIGAKWKYGRPNTTLQERSLEFLRLKMKSQVNHIMLN